MKLWNYGDSHAARHEPDSANDIGLSWLKDATGVNSRLEAKEKLGKNYKHLVKDKWYKYIREGNRCSTLLEGSPCSPELSYAGIVTRNIEATLMTRARPGAINDLSILRMFEDYNKWHKDDLYNLWTQGLVHLAKSLHNNMICIGTTQDDITVKQ
jgi:hypothetical protein